MKVKLVLKKLSGSIRSKSSGRKSSKKLPVCVGSISLAGSCFRDELDDYQQKTANSSAADLTSLADSLTSMTLSQYEMCGLCNGPDGAQPHGALRHHHNHLRPHSTCSSMATSSSSASFPVQEDYSEDEDQLYMTVHVVDGRHLSAPGAIYNSGSKRIEPSTNAVLSARTLGGGFTALTHVKNH